MAFTGKIGNLLRQTVSKPITGLSASNPSLFQAIRCMSSSKLFVGGISYGTDDMGLRDAFSSYGEVIEARVILDRDTGRSRGFGFVTFTSSEEASAAISAMDGKYFLGLVDIDDSFRLNIVTMPDWNILPFAGQQDLHGRMVRVNYAIDRAGYRGGGGYGGGGSSYGGGSYGAGGGSYGGGGYNSGGNYSRSGGGYGDEHGSSSGGGSSYGGSGSGDMAYGGGPSGGSYGVAGGDSDWGAAAKSDGFATGGGTGNYGTSGEMSHGASDPLDDNQDSMDDSQEDPLEGNYRDDDAEPDDYANRRG